MKLEEIKPIAEKYRNMLAPYCVKDKCKIAGSIRREKAECGDIEIVLVRNEDMAHSLEEVLMNTVKIRGTITGRYTQRMLPEGIKIDIFMAQEDNWGNIFLIRTGNWKFSRFMMGIRAKQVGLLHREGYLWRGAEQIYCYEEEDVFRWLEMDWVEPKDREWD